jgi:GNAT superfamily N-acetyltransferase
MKINNNTRMLMSKAYVYFLKTYADLIDQGVEYPRTKWNDIDCGIMWAEENDTPIGFLMYDHRSPGQQTKTLTVLVAFVSEEHRNKDVYEQMISNLEEYAKQQGYHALSFTVHNNNLDLLAVARGNGYNAEHYIMMKRI